jgi:hypothetical protein
MAALLAFAPVAYFASYGIYVGKNLTADGGSFWIGPHSP